MFWATYMEKPHPSISNVLDVYKYSLAEYKTSLTSCCLGITSQYSLFGSYYKVMDQFGPNCV